MVGVKGGMWGLLAEAPALEKSEERTSNAVELCGIID
jgi:hypothetical protein